MSDPLFNYYSQPQRGGRDGPDQHRQQQTYPVYRGIGGGKVLDTIMRVAENVAPHVVSVREDVKNIGLPKALVKNLPEIAKGIGSALMTPTKKKKGAGVGAVSRGSSTKKGRKSKKRKKKRRLTNKRRSVVRSNNNNYYRRPSSGGVRKKRRQNSQKRTKKKSFNLQDYLS